MKRLVFVTVIALMLGLSTLGNAALLDRGADTLGNHLIYDTDLGITWYDAPAVFGTWGDSMTWAQTLRVSTTYLSNITGWRLPNTVPVHGSTYNYDYSYNGSTDLGYNISAPGSAYPGSKGSEMAYLFYVDLGNKGLYTVGGSQNQSGVGLVNTGPFTNLLPFDYWSGTAYSGTAWPGPFLHGGAWIFDGDGLQGAVGQASTMYALAVHSGDVGAPVPIPGAILLFAPGLVGLGAIRRRFILYPMDHFFSYPTRNRRVSLFRQSDPFLNK